MKVGWAKNMNIVHLSVVVLQFIVLNGWIANIKKSHRALKIRTKLILTVSMSLCSPGSSAVPKSVGFGARGSEFNPNSSIYPCVILYIFLNTVPQFLHL